MRRSTQRQAETARPASGTDTFRVAKDPRPSWEMLLGSTRWRTAPPWFAGRPFFEFFWGRNAIYHGLRALGLKAGDVVLTPAFHCATLVDPILHYGARVVFYNVRRDGQVDLEDVAAKGEGAKALLAVHYFGFPQPIRQLRQLCEQLGLRLIEDCAHVLRGQTEGSELGSFGDVGVFSWRKFLPVEDGGQLVLNDSALQLGVDWDRRSLTRELRVFGAVAESPARLYRIARSVRNRFRRGREAGEVRPGAPRRVEPSSVEFESSTLNSRPSLLSSRISRRLDFAPIIERRRANYSLLANGIAAIRGVAPFADETPPGLCPWVFPIVVPGVDAAHKRLRSRGIPAVAWDGVIHPSLPLSDFPDAEHLYHEVTLLPVHQDLTPYDLELMLESIAGVVRDCAHRGKVRA